MDKMDKPSIDWKTIKKIAILNYITTTVGDTLYILPFIHRLKKEAPQAEIIITGSKLGKELIGEDPHIKKYIEINNLELLADSSSKIKKMKLVGSIIKQSVKELKKEKPDICFVLLPNFALYQTIPFLAKVPLRYGFSYPGSIFKFLLNKTTPYRNPGTTGEVNIHLVESNLYLLESIGLKIEENDKILIRTVSNEEKKSAQEILKKLNGPFIGFQPGARYKMKMWPPERFIELGKSLSKDYNIFLFGSKYEFELCEKIKKEIGNNCINLTNDLPIGTTAAILEKCELFVGNDSGIGHLASSVGIKTIILMGNSDPRQCYPFGIKKPVVIVSPNWIESAGFELFDKNISKDVYSKYLLDISAKDVIEICKRTIKEENLSKFVSEKKVYEIKNNIQE